MRILVAVASTHGSTRQLGQVIAETFAAAGHEAICADVESDPDLDVDAVVLGTAVYIGRPLAAARDFAERLERLDPPLPVFAFAVGLKNITADPLRPPFTLPLARPYLGGRYPIFGGVADGSQLTMPERALIGIVGATGQDFRDEDLVAAWAADVVVELEKLTQAA